MGLRAARAESPGLTARAGLSMKKATRGSPSLLRARRGHAASSHIAVSNALLIIGMFMPKFALAEFFEALAGLSATLWATSVARSHDPFSWERATEKNRST